MYVSDEQKDALVRAVAAVLIGRSPLATEEERGRADELVAGIRAAVIREGMVALSTIRDQVTANMRKHQAQLDEAALMDDPDLAEWNATMRGFYE